MPLKAEQEPNYDTAPNGWGPIWRRYVEDGLLPGGFGISLLCNDLTGACMRADYVNKGLLFEHVTWMVNNLPYGTWGDEKIVKDYVTVTRKTPT